MKLAICMIVSSGEEDISRDCLSRISRLIPDEYKYDLHIGNNTGRELCPGEWNLPANTSWINIPGAPRPYFEIGRTIFLFLDQLHPQSFDLLLKIDPDTVILSPDYFHDLVKIHEESQADFIAPHAIYRVRGDNLKRWLRLLGDCLPVGLSRTEGGNRFGLGRKMRWKTTWHGKFTLSALCRGRWPYAQPTGGGYVLSASVLSTVKAKGLLAAKGAIGLEWNDDILMPIAVRSIGGTVVDIRQTRFAEGWKYMHGARYFTREDLQEPGLRAVHPLKDAHLDREIRQLIEDNPCACNCKN